MIARDDYVGPITKSAERMFARAERHARRPTTQVTSRPIAETSALPKRPAPAVDSPIQRVLSEAGLSLATLRHWEDAGVIAFARRAGRRLVDDETLARLSAVIALRRAGFTVRQIVWLSQEGPPSLAQMREALAVRTARLKTSRETSLRRLRARP